MLGCGKIIISTRVLGFTHCQLLRIVSALYPLYSGRLIGRMWISLKSTFINPSLACSLGLHLILVERKMSGMAGVFGPGCVIARDHTLLVVLIPHWKSF